MSGGSLDSLTVPTPKGDGTFTWEVPDGWQQGRGAFGGLVLNALCRAAMAFEDDPSRPPRAMSGELTGPVLPGEAMLAVRLLRRGSTVTTLDVSLRQEDEIRARASFVFGGARQNPTPFPDRPAREPVSLDWEQAPVLPTVEGSGFPVFAPNFEFRLAGALPFQQGDEARAGGWVRAKIRPSAIGPAEVLTYADVWWPAGFTVERAPRPAATIGFQLQWLADPGTLDPEAPLLCLSRVAGSRDGYLAETRELFAPDGQLVAINQQTFVWI